MACERITRGIVARHVDERPVKAVLDPYNAAGSTRRVRFTTSKTTLWKTDPRHCHINYVVCDSEWEAEFCPVAQGHPRVRAYVKNHGLGLEVSYRLGGEARTYIPDFIVLVDDGRGEDDPLHLIVEIKGYRREDAKVKKATMETYWVPGVNALGTFGRWVFAEFTDVYEIEAGFSKLIEGFLPPAAGIAATTPGRTLCRSDTRIGPRASFNMVTKLYTEAELDALRSTPKRITNPGARWLEKPNGIS